MFSDFLFYQLFYLRYIPRRQFVQYTKKKYNTANIVLAKLIILTLKQSTIINQYNLLISNKYLFE